MRNGSFTERRTNPDERLPKHLERRKDSGARHAKISLRDRFRSYLSNHRAVAINSLMRLLGALASTTMTWMVIAIALALPVGLFVGLQNVQQLSAGWDRAVQISVFLKLDAEANAGREFSEEIARRVDVVSTQFISKDEALAEFRASSGFGEALEYLQGNPLPAVVVVLPDAASSDVETLQGLVTELRNNPLVDQVQLDLEWVQRLYSLMALGQRAVLILASMLSLAVLLIIGNTIRLAIESRRDEIVVIKLVGGTDRFVRRPFLYSGVWYGLGGGVLAWLLINIILFWLSSPVDRLARAYSSNFDLQGLGFTYSLLLFAISATLGLVGAWVAVGRHISEIEPR